MGTIEIIIGVGLLLVCVLLIIFCLLQDQKTQQNMTSAITGGSNDSFYGKNTGRTKEAALNKITKILAGLFFIATIVVNLIPNLINK
ncbi:MAG: preprotein translocase subunit SecG [Clostridiales bacterium]|nr:preprotein translocase subunit SecG [Clostridiales bacterium]